MTGRILDLDAARAARAEQWGEAPTLRFGGADFELPHELPAEYGWLLIEKKTREAFALLLGDRGDEFWALGPSRDDLHDLAAGIPELYGLGSEEKSSASRGSSQNGSNHSRPTSNASTESTSEPPVSAGRRSV